MILALAISSSLVAEWQPIEVEATAYCPCTVCTNGKGVTANQTKVLDAPFNVAVSRDAEKQIPMGATVWIPSGEGYLDVKRADDREFKVDDRMGKEARSTLSTRPLIDLRYRTHYSARLFGRKLITIYVWRD